MNDPCPDATLAPGSRPRLARQARIQTDKVSGKPVLLYPEGVLVLNPTGAAILEQCDGRRTLAEIVTVLAERYAAPAEQMHDDVAEYLGRLQQKGLLEIKKDLE